MEIIPTKFTLLFIAAVLAIISFSLIYFRLKRKRQKRENEIPQLNSIEVKTNSNPDKIKYLQRGSILQKLKPINIKKEKIVERSQNIAIGINNNKHRKISKDNKKELTNYSRIEVLNSKHSNDENKKIKPEANDDHSNLKSLGRNVFNNYSDEEKNDLFILKVKDPKDKTKNS